VARAIALMIDHHKRHGELMKVRDLLRLVPDTSRPALYRDKSFVATRQTIKAVLAQRVPRGHRTEGGGIEAEDGDRDEAEDEDQDDS
jgi:hypothetical protein